MSQNMNAERRQRISKTVELATDLFEWCERVKGFHPLYVHLDEKQMNELIAEFTAQKNWEAS